MKCKDTYTFFLKIAAICSFLGASTTALLIFLPNPEVTDLASRAMLHQNNLYQFKLWLLFIHPQFNIIASLGIALLLFRKFPARILIGTLFLCIWAYTEMSQQALLIDSLNQIWRPGYLAAEDPVARSNYSTLIEVANGISDSKYFMVIYAFGIGSLLYGTAMINLHGLGKYLGYSLAFIGILSLLSFARYYLNLDFLNPFVDWSYTYIYPYLQPLVRIGIGIWILKNMTTEKFVTQPINN